MSCCTRRQDAVAVPARAAGAVGLGAGGARRAGRRALAARAAAAPAAAPLRAHHARARHQGSVLLLFLPTFRAINYLLLNRINIIVPLKHTHNSIF